MPEPRAAPDADKYVVRAAEGGWTLSRGAQDLETFADSAAAVAAACRAAREAALGGRLSLVVAETEPQELHCYMPRLGADTGPAAPLAGYLRLIVPGT